MMRRFRLSPRAAPTLVLALVAAIWIGCADQRPDSPAAPTRGPDFAAVDPQEIRAAIAAQERHTPQLMQNPSVVGTGVGLSAAGNPVIRLFLANAAVGNLPTHLDGIPVETRVTGIFYALSEPTTRARPAPLGFSVGHPDITAGTIGARVTDGTFVYILSNNHVLANSNNATIGDPTLQPGPFDGGTEPDDIIGTLADFQVISFSSDNTMDAAIALVDPSDLSGSTPTDDAYGAPSSQIFGDGNNDGSFDNIQDLLNLDVKKYGRTTALTHGKVTAINAEVAVCYVARGPFMCAQAANFVDQLVIEPGDFSAGGDSGSLIVTESSGNNPVGLLFAGSSTHTIANRIDLVLQRFEVTVDPSDAAPADPVTDIAIVEVDAPSTATRDNAVNVAVTVQNVGNQNVSADIGVSLSSDLDGAIGNQTVNGGLSAGASTTLNFSWTPANAGTHTLTASHDFDDDNAANDSNTASTTVNEPGAAGTMHIDDLAGSSTNQGSTWTASVTITVRDNTGALVSGASVSGTWTGAGSGSGSCTTDLNGQCTVTRTGIAKRNSSVSYAVDDVTHGSLTYDPNQNVDTSIVVSKP